MDSNCLWKWFSHRFLRLVEGSSSADLGIDDFISEILSYILIFLRSKCLREYIKLYIVLIASIKLIIKVTCKSKIKQNAHQK